MFKKIMVTYLISQLSLFPTTLWGQNVKVQEKKSTYNIKELVMPSEIKGMGKSSGAIYYSPTIKGKVLVPVHFWGAINRTGLHYLPLETSLLKGLSFAGGPASSALLEEIKVIRKEGKEVNEMIFDVSEGGDIEAYNFNLKPGDTVFVQTDHFFQNRAYYTSLIGIVATILSTILIYRQVRDPQ